MRVRASRAEQVEQNRARVLAAARQVFLARGYAGATVDAIAEAAGFSKGVVYSQFDSKADMFLDLLAARISERAAENARLAEQDAREQHAGEQETAAVVQAAMRLMDSQERAEPEWTMLVLEFRVHAARVPELAKRYAELHERTVTELAAVFARLHERAGTTPLYPVRSLAELILALGAGTALERAANPAALPFEHVGGYAARTIASAAGRDGQP
jgi:AcrR family transcriptional regulator